MERVEPYSLYLTGNPNSGKTTLFNRLTGSRQTVGNYPGITVETIEGTCIRGEQTFRFIDLPGTYSLSAYSGEESITRDMLLKKSVDAVVDVVDASNLERSLYLALQLKEVGVPLILLLNKWDIVEHQGLKIDIEALSEMLGTPCFPVIGETGEGIEEFLSFVEKGILQSGAPLPFAPEVDAEVGKLVETPLLSDPDFSLPPYWAAVRLIEDGPEALIHLGLEENLFTEAVVEFIEKRRDHIRKVFGEDPHIVLTEDRYGQIRGILKDCVSDREENRFDVSDRLDKILLNRFLGVPIFGLMMFLLFYIPFSLGAPLTDYLEKGIGMLGELVRSALPEGFFRELVVNGVIGGVGGVLVFVPQIMLLFACLAFLEASGYMARAAFVVDRFMHKLGLHGKSFVPLIIGFGCTVPALMATRTLDSRRDRLATMLALPFISCSARLPVYTLFVGTFVPRGYQSGAMFALYFLGVLVAMATARFARKVLYKGGQSHLVMELPPYRIPTLVGVFHQMWMKAWHYLRKAGTVILAAGIIFWVLTNIPKPSPASQEQFKVMQHSARIEHSKRVTTLVKRLALPMRGQGAENALTNAPPFRSITADMDRLASLEHSKTHHAGSPGWLAAQREKIILKKKILKEKVWADALVDYRHSLTLFQKERAEANNLRIAAARRFSITGRIGEALSPLLAPAGLDNWTVSVALLGGFIAKEVVVGTLGTLYGLGDETDEESFGLRQRLLAEPFFLSKTPVADHRVFRAKEGWHLDDASGLPLQKKGDRFYPPDFLVIASLLVFVLLYLPCQAAVIVYAREVGWRHALFMVFYTMVVAYVMATIVYQGGRLLGL